MFSSILSPDIKIRTKLKLYGMDNKDAKANLLQLQQSAEQGDAESQGFWGQFLLQGLYGIPKDPVKGIEFLKQSAKKGNAMAQETLGSCLVHGIEVKQQIAAGIKFLEASAKQGYTLAECNLGTYLLVYKRDLKGLEWLKKAADKGYPLAQFHLGNFIFNIDDSATKEGLDLIYKAAVNGDPQAQFAIGKYLYEGFKVKKDTENGLQWIQSAAQFGDNDAKVYLSTHHLPIQSANETKTVEPKKKLKKKKRDVGKVVHSTALIADSIEKKNEEKHIKQAETLSTPLQQKLNAINFLASIESLEKMQAELKKTTHWQDPEHKKFTGEEWFKQLNIYKDTQDAKKPGYDLDYVLAKAFNDLKDYYDEKNITSDLEMVRKSAENSVVILTNKIKELKPAPLNLKPLTQRLEELNQISRKQESVKQAGSIQQLERKLAEKRRALQDLREKEAKEFPRTPEDKDATEKEDARIQADLPQNQLGAGVPHFPLANMFEAPFIFPEIEAFKNNLIDLGQQLNNSIAAIQEIKKACGNVTFYTYELEMIEKQYCFLFSPPHTIDICDKTRLERWLNIKSEHPIHRSPIDRNKDIFDLPDLKASLVSHWETFESKQVGILEQIKIDVARGIQELTYEVNQLQAHFISEIRKIQQSQELELSLQTKIGALEKQISAGESRIKNKKNKNRKKKSAAEAADPANLLARSLLQGLECASWSRRG